MRFGLSNTHSAPDLIRGLAAREIPGQARDVMSFALTRPGALPLGSATLTPGYFILCREGASC